MDLRETGKEQAVTGLGKVDARASQDAAIECAGDGQQYCGRNDSLPGGS